MSFINIDITKRYPDFVLKCSLDFNNKINGIFGPSGSGKSTILNCIAGFVSPDVGNIKINDKILYKISGATLLRNDNISLNAEHRNIGYVTQKSNLFPSMNVDENIRYGYKDDNGIKVEEIIEKFKKLEEEVETQLQLLSPKDIEDLAQEGEVLKESLESLLQAVICLEEECAQKIGSKMREVEKRILRLQNGKKNGLNVSWLLL